MTRSLTVGVVVLALAAGCGKSEQAKQAEQTAEAAKQVAQGAEAAAGQAQQGLQQMMQGLQQMAGGQPGQAPAPLVDYELLKGLIPEFSGWERTGVKGQQVTMGIAVSSAEAHYSKGDASIKLEIVDTSFSQVILAPFMMFARAGYSERSDNGYKKGITLAGYPGFETFEKDQKDAEVHLLVGNRFMVNAEASGVDNADAPRALAQAVDLSKLSGLK